MLRSRMFRALSFGAALGACVTLFAPDAAAQTYKLDDGTAGYALSYAYPEDFCWLNHLNAGGAVTLTSIEAILGDTPDGWPVTFCIWRDLGGSGQPWDGLLLNSVTTTAKNSGTQMLTEYAIPPTQVTGSFFVGAFLTTDGSLNMATLDPHTNLPGESWFATGYGPGTFDPTYLGNWTWYAPQTLGIKGVFMLRANGSDGPTPEARCTAKTNSLGCTPTISFSGVSSATVGSGFTLHAANVINRKSGLFTYSLGGLQQVPFAGGTLCIRPPFRRTSLANSGGSGSGLDCTGSYAIDFNAYIASGVDPALVAGVTVDGQFWSRDPGFAAPNNVGLTQAAHFGVGP